MSELLKARFSKKMTAQADAFNASIAVDGRLVFVDIAGSIAHATMLQKQGILSAAEGECLVSELKTLSQQLESGSLSLDPSAEDVHMFVEAVLIERLGDVGKKLHTGRSRNDQVATDLRLYLKEQTQLIQDHLRDLIQVIVAKAKDHIHILMPGYTHLQIAQPVTFAHHLLAYGWMFVRDLERLQDSMKRLDVLPLGSGALAATSYPLDREFVAEQLGFACISANSMDAVSDRDFCVELSGIISLIMVHLSRFSEDIILWSSSEFQFIELDDAYASGSSIMPQKKNPDIAELVRGKTGRTLGNHMALLTLLKGLPMTYNKDLQEDKEAMFDSIDTVTQALPLFAAMIDTLAVNESTMKQAALKGFINATDCADYLVNKGVAFRDAYAIVGALVRFCLAHDQVLEAVPYSVYESFSSHFDPDIHAFLDIEACLNRRDLPGGPAPVMVEKQIAGLLEELAVLTE